MDISEPELAAFHETVARLRALPADDPVRLRAERVAESFARDGRQRRKKVRGAEHAAADAAVDARTATGGRTRREDVPLRAEPGAVARPLARSRRCYVCKNGYRLADPFYHRLCPACAEENAARRTARADLTGRRALLTGGRVKIGFQLALMLLRDGAELLVTTRFPRDAVRRFHTVPGSEAWLDRLSVVGVDLRDPRQVLGLCESPRDEGRPFSILVNNAAQTVRRPPEAYAVLAGGEIGALPPNARLAPGFHQRAALAHGRTALAAVLDEAGLLPDTAPANSWSIRIGELDPAEVLETQLVNALAPSLLCDRLLPLLLASPHPRRYVVNVTAVEGRFAVRNKTAGHPHTNMAKAALNMLARTGGPDLARRGVYMCAVDTGWITDENPAPKRARTGFRTPLDIVDGAARVYDPIVRGEAGAPVAGALRPGVVRHLLLGTDGLGDEGAAGVAGQAVARGVETLYLGCNGITAGGACRIADSLRMSPQAGGVTGVWLKRNPLGAGAGDAAAAIVESARALRTLDLVQTGMTAEGLGVLVTALITAARSGRRVERLYAGGNPLGPAGATHLAALVRAGAVDELYVSAAGLGSLGAETLADALVPGGRLRRISVASNGIGPVASAGFVTSAVAAGVEVCDLGRVRAAGVLGAPDNRLDEQATTTIAHALAARPHRLRHLVLSDTGLCSREAHRLLDGASRAATPTRFLLGKGIATSIRRGLAELCAGIPLRPTEPAAVTAIRSVHRQPSP